jgi:hypothetical protein
MHWIDNTERKKYKWPINTWKILNIFSHQRNVIQNHIEIPSHPSQNGYHQQNKKQPILAMMWEKETLTIQLVRLQIS